MGERNFMRLEIAGRPENVSLARVAVAAFASQLDFTLGEIEEIKVAASEAVSNAVVHAYDSPGTVKITCTLNDGRLEIEVSDQGRGIEDPDQARQASYSTCPDRMGLGFSFMESFMDELAVDSRPGEGTRVRMTKTPGTCPGGDDGATGNPVDAH